MLAAVELSADERRDAAERILVEREGRLRGTARRFSMCEDDANDAFQRGMEILLKQAPTNDPVGLTRWAHTVIKHEAIAISRYRARTFEGQPIAGDHESEDWMATFPDEHDGPFELAARREEIARSYEALQSLKPQELRTLSLFAEGYSYLEIGALTGYSQTKVNRCLAEGRARYRLVLGSIQDGSRCLDLRPLLSKANLNPKEHRQRSAHLKACAPCRAIFRRIRQAMPVRSAPEPVHQPAPTERNTMQDLIGLLDQAIEEHEDKLNRARAAKRSLEGKDQPGRKPAPAESTPDITPRAAKPKRRRRKGVNRAEQAVALVTANPGITASKIAEEMKIKPNYLYRVMADLENQGKVKKTGRTYTAV